MDSVIPTSAEVIARLKQILKLDAVVKIFYVDDTINSTGFDLERVFTRIRDTLGDLKVNSQFVDIFGSSVDFTLSDDDIIFSQIELILRSGDTAYEQLFAYLFPGEPLVKDDIDEELRALFDDLDFESLHPKEAVEKIGNYIQNHAQGNIVFLFDFDFGGQMSTNAVRNGGDLILKICRAYPDKQVHMIFAIITHLVEQGEEIERRGEFLAGDLQNLKPVPFLLSKKRKTNQLLLADGIKKTLLNKLVEKIKSETINILEHAFKETKGLLNTLDTYEFEHIIVKSSLAEGVWMGRTLRRLSTVLFENSVSTQMVKHKYLKNVNPIFENIIDYSLIHLITKSENKPYNNREFLRYTELYSKGETLNNLYEPVANGDIFEVELNNIPGNQKAHYILIGQDCDIILRSSGNRNRRQRFFSLLPIEIISKEDLNNEVITFAQKWKDINHYMASKFVLPYYTSQDFSKVGLVNFNNELVVYIDVIDLVSINSSGEAAFDKTFSYPVSEFSHSLRNRYNNLIKICAKFDKDITAIESGIGSLGNTVKEKVRSKFIKTLSPISDDKGAKNPHLAEGKFNFGIRRISRFRKEHSSILLSKYMQFISRAALDHDFALEVQE